MRIGLIAAIILAFAARLAAAELPTVIDPNLSIELVAAEPDIVTPTGIAVDSKGRVWCLENQTHQRGPEYKGPPTDRVRVFEDFDAKGKARKVWTFTEGFRDSMGLTFGGDGAVYLATRANIYRLRQKDDKETERTVIMKLETKGNYPHNGLCGFAWDGNGDLIFGLGENLGESYKLIGSDGTTLGGGGEGGSMYRCRPDGSKLSRIATGFWNPFAHCFDARGNLFMVDNDPDARGPCRLIHVVQGGDYGYRFRYGRKGIHPFNAWNGELPGTLPMVAGTSEAPSGVLACDFAALPESYAGKLLVTSWGDHTIEAFELSPRGASFSAKPKVIVRGDENFRPVAMAIAPDGSIVVSDWVDKSYPVHGKGRIWRIRSKSFSGKPKAPAAAIPLVRTEAMWLEAAETAGNERARAQAIRHLRSPEVVKAFIPTLADADPFLVSAALESLGRPGNASMLREGLSAKPKAALRLGLLLAFRRTGEVDARNEIPGFLGDPDPAVRRAAIQWVAEEKLKEFAGSLREAALKPPVTRELLEAWVKANELLSGKKLPPNLPEEADTGIAFQLLFDEKLPQEIRALALRMLPPESKLIHPGLLERYANGGDELALECIRTAMLRTDLRALTALKTAITSADTPAHRNLAVAGLASFADRDEVQELLVSLLDKPEARYDALRSLRGVTKQADAMVKWWDRYRTTLDDPLKIDRDLLEQYSFTLRTLKLGPEDKPRTRDEWRAILKDGGGDPRAGERVFFHARGPNCANCHRIDARGQAVGPDLTLIGRSMSRDKLIESILEPSKEIAPAFTSWKLLTRDGKERIGMIAGETHDSLVTLVDSQGKVEKIRRTDIEERTALKQSIMPDELPARMTRREFIDLIAFLMERK